MILQRNQPVPVWGTADPGEAVRVEFGDVTKTTTADGRGDWRVDLDPMPADTTPRELVIRGKNTLTLSGILVGEVWLCGGQSNMAMALGEADGAAEEMRKADPMLRAYRVPERPGERAWKSVDGRWIPFDEASARQWAALPYFLAKTLQKSLGVPVGVIICAWGGSSAVTWMSPEILQGADLRSVIPEEVIGWRTNVQPSRLYHGMLAPIAPFAVAGVAWYQGETDGEPSMNPFFYRRLFPALITDWRALWRRPELPFYWVQLPNLQKKETWPIIREGQSAALTLPRTGMVPTLDIGQEKNLHPTNKHAFGKRLADLILAREYGKSGGPEFPEFVAIERGDGGMKVRFRNVPGGLKTTDGKAPVGFQIASAGGDFLPAEAKVEGDTVMLPLADEVRYAWEGNPRVNLVNADGQPAMPFRTDTRPVAGEALLPQELPRKDQLPLRVHGAALARGESAEWSLRAEGVPLADLENQRILRVEGKFCQLAVSGLRRGSLTSESPAVFWEAASLPRITSGLTLEARLQMYRATDPFRGFDLEAIIADNTGKFRRYRMAVVPMRIFAFGDKTIGRLASNLDNSTGSRRYRLAIRPDGVAQVYYESALIGTFDGEVIDPPAGALPSVRVGKLVDRGEFTANLFEIALDSGGAFSPSP